MSKEELQQTRSGLLDLAMAHGYQAAELALLSSVYFTAQGFVTGEYRSCGRPLINHLAGTASVLLRYDFRIEIVMAGLLHAAYPIALYIRKTSRRRVIIYAVNSVARATRWSVWSGAIRSRG